MSPAGPSTQSCATVRALLSPAQDGELDRVKKQQVEDHLGGCESCRRAAVEMQHLSGILRDAGRRVPAPPTWREVEERWHTGGGAQASPFRHRGWLAAAATLMAGSVIGALLLDLTGDGKAPVGSAAESAELAAAEPSGSPGVPSPRPSAGAAGETPGSGAPPTPPRPIAATDDGVSPSPVELVLAAATRPTERNVRLLADALQPPNIAELAVQDAEARAGFRPNIPEELPGGFRLQRCQLMSTPACRAIRLRYQRGDDSIELLQQPADAAINWQQARLQGCVLSGRQCRRSVVGEVQFVQVVDSGLNIVVIAPRESVDVETVVAALVERKPAATRPR